MEICKKQMYTVYIRDSLNYQIYRVLPGQLYEDRAGHLHLIGRS